MTLKKNEIRRSKSDRNYPSRLPLPVAQWPATVQVSALCQQGDLTSHYHKLAPATFSTPLFNPALTSMFTLSEAEYPSQTPDWKPRTRKWYKHDQLRTYLLGD